MFQRKLPTTPPSNREMLLLISQALLLLATQQDTPEIPGKQDHIYATFLHCELLFTGHNT